MAKLTLLTFAVLLATAPIYASQKCSHVLVSEASKVEIRNHKSQYVPNLFSDISTSDTITLKGGEVVRFQDKLFLNKSSLISVVQGSGWRGLLEMSKEKDQISFDVISLEGDKLIRFIDIVGQTPLVEGRGIPTSSYLTMRGLKLMGLKGINKIKVSKIRHAETVLHIAREIKNRFDQDGSHLISAADFLDLYSQQSLHRLAETAATQAGFDIDGLSLQLRDFRKVTIKPHEMIRTPHSPKATYEVRVPADPKNPDGAHYSRREFYPWAEGTHELTWHMPLLAAQITSPHVDREQLKKHVDALVAANAEIKQYPFDFSVIYHLSPR